MPPTAPADPAQGDEGMMLRRLVAVVLSLPLMVACTDPADRSEAAGQSPPARERDTQIVLPDGLTCRWRPGSSPNGPYDCGIQDGAEVRLAAPPLVTGTTLRATVSVIPPAGLPRREALVAEIEELALFGGTVCRHAGRGATLTLDQQRLNFTCRGAAFDGLVGDLRGEGARYVGLAVQAEEVSGTRRLRRVGRVAVSRILLRGGSRWRSPFPFRSTAD